MKRMNLTALRPHEAQVRIYGEEPTDKDLADSIGNHGILENIVALPDGRILSGHRRWRAALDAGVVFADVVVRALDTNHEQIAALVEYNRQRTKTPYQIAQEMKALLWVEKEKARKRQRGGQGGVLLPANLPEAKKGDARDKVAERYGVSGRTVQKQVAVAEAIEELEEAGLEADAEDIKMTLNTKSVSAAHRKVKSKKPQPSKAVYTSEAWMTLGEAARQGLISAPGRSTFNRTNDMVDWADYTWNPVTGCLHNCPYCYARDIANRFYEHRFDPVFHPERLGAPERTRPGGEAGTKRNVFTCSMADLFGRWVPQDWIDAVLDRMRTHNLWRYLVLTKFPQRLSEQDWPDNTWVGATVDVQSRVDLTMKAFSKVKSESNAEITWLSLEPLLEPLRFESLEMFDMVVIGGASRSTKTPQWWPPLRWIVDIMDQADREGVAVYLKENAVKELPSRRAAPASSKAPDAFFTP